LSVRFFLDHNVDPAVARGLQRRGIDVITAREDGRAATPDEDLIQRATELGRVLVSHDADMPTIAARWQASGQYFSGIIYTKQRRLTVGQLVAELEIIAGAAATEEFQNSVTYLPL
jgi:hypothetical protein